MNLQTIPLGGRARAHLHSSHETAIYVLSGQVRFTYGPGMEHTVDAAAGDFVFVPPNEIHMEQNLSETEPVKLIVSRGCTSMLVINVPDPRESQ